MSGTAGAPKVTLNEVRIAGGAVSGNGAYCAMVIPAPRGPIDQPVLIATEAQLVSTFSPEGTLLPSYDSSFWVAIDNLKRTNALWVMRAATQPFYGAAYVRVAQAVSNGAANAAGAAEFGFENVLHYDLTTTDGRINPGPVSCTADSTPGYLTTTAQAYAAIQTGDAVTVANTGGVLPLGLSASTTYYAIKTPLANKVQLALSAANAAAAIPLSLTSTGLGTQTLSVAARAVANAAFTADIAAGTVTVSSSMYDLLDTGDHGTFAAASGGTLPSGLQGGATATATTTAPTLSGTALSVATSGLAAGMTVTGTNVPASTTVASITNANSLVLSQAVTGPVASGATLTFSTTAATTASMAASGTTLNVPTSGLSAGMAVTGAGVVSNTTIASITNATSLVLSQASTAGIASGVTVTFATTANTTAATNPTVLAVPTASLSVGMTVSGGGVTSGTTIASITNANSLVLSQAVTAAVASGVTLTFTAAAVTYYAIKSTAVNKLQFATTLANAQNGVAIDLIDTGSGAFTFNFASVVATTPGQDKALLIYAQDPGDYNNNISFTLTNYATNPVAVKVPGDFLIQVYYRGVAIPGESWVCSFDPSHKNGYNQSDFVTSVLAASKWVNAEVNPILPASTQVADVLVQQQLSGGSDGLVITDSSMSAALSVFQNTAQYPVSFVHDSGWTTPGYQTSVISLAEQIGSACAFLSTPYTSEITSNALNDVIAYVQNSVTSQSTHAGIFSPHVQVQDSYNNRQLWIAPVGQVAGDYAQTFVSYSPGQPVGGTYGPMNCIDTAHHWTDPEMDVLYNNNINPIRFKQGKGIQIYGQKTLQSTPGDLDRLNARMVLMIVEPALRNAYEGLLFSRNSVSNDSGTRRQIKLLTDNYMAQIQARGGVYNWLTICDSSNNSLTDVANETINVWLLVQIVKAVEYIPFTIAATPTDVSFTLATTLIQ